MSNSNSYEEAISKASASVINISSKKNIETRLFDGRSPNGQIGSGIIISNDGYIITNLHVIKRAKIIEV
jgi:serine protease DegS